MEDKYFVTIPKVWEGDWIFDQGLPWSNIQSPSKTWGLVAQIFFLNILTITDMFPCGPIWKYLSAREQVKGKIECLLFVNWGQIFCHQLERFGRWLNIWPRRKYFTFQNLKAGDRNSGLKFMKNKQYYLFQILLKSLNYLLHIFFHCKNLAVTYGNIWLL